MLQLFKSICASRFCWFLLFVSGIALEACGLYFQYELHLNPCVNCVYERAYFLGFVVAGFIGAMAANYLIVRFLCAAGFLASAIGGLLITWEHYRAYTSTSLFGNTCKLEAQFPDFLPLDNIAPWMFKPLGLCSDKLDWELLGQSMPFWILVAFACATVIAFMMLISFFVKKKTSNFDRLYK